MNVKPRVIYWTNIPSPYMVERFNAIAADGKLDFEAWFNARREPDRSWDVDESRWDFRYEYVSSTGVSGLPGLVRRLLSEQPDVFVSLYGSTAFALGALAARAMGIKVVLHALKTFDTWVERAPLREAAKRFLFPRVSAFHVAGPDSAEYVARYGAHRDSIYAFPEPIRVEHFARGAAEARASEGLRESLGLKGCVFLHVGRLWQGKGLDYLMTAYRRLREDGLDVSLFLVGDGVDEARYRAMADDMPGVVFSGFIQQPDLPRFYGVADALVFPTLGDPYGHVVQEAMASSLAVIATENAGDIRERVKDGSTGFIVPAADSEALYQRMRLLALNEDLRRSMGREGFKVIEPRTVEWWAGEFEQMISSVVSVAETGPTRTQVAARSGQP